MICGVQIKIKNYYTSPPKQLSSTTPNIGQVPDYRDNPNDIPSWNHFSSGGALEKNSWFRFDEAFVASPCERKGWNTAAHVFCQ
jgi:hypothetical protein